MRDDDRRSEFASMGGSISHFQGLDWRKLKGKKIHEAGRIKNAAIVQELNLPPIKIRCPILPKMRSKWP